MIRRQIRRIPISRVDRLWLGATVTTTVGPIVVPERSAVVDALIRLASAGPSTRVGLRFASRSRRHWIYRLDDIEQWADSCVVSLPPGSDADLDALMGRLSEEFTGDHPVQFFLADRHVLVMISHALGDSRLSLALPSVIVSMTRSPDLPAWATTGVDPRPLWSALRHTFPDRQSWRRLITDRRSLRPQQLTVGPAGTTAFVPRAVAITETGEARATHALKVWTRHNAPGAGHFAIVLAGVHQALAEEGIACEPGVHMLYDLHRYLPYGHHTTGNFVGGLDLPVPANDPIAVTDAVRRTAKSGRPLAAVTAAVLRSGFGKRQPPTAVVPTEPRARLALSYVGPKTLDETLPWAAGPGERSYWCRVDPAGATALTLLVAVVDDRLLLSASFHGTVFDPHAVRRALRAVHTDAVGLLARAGVGVGAVSS